MKLIASITGFRRRHARCVATIGKFDGVHLGHQAIVRQLRERAAHHDAPAVVIVIEPHPEEFFAESPDTCPGRLTNVDEKVDLLAALGVDYVYKLRFDTELSKLSAQEYVTSILVQGLGVAALIVGDDFRFGHQRQGDFALLQACGRQHDFEVIRTHSCTLNGQRVSSTRVREVLASDDFDAARALLGRPYAITGTVIEGRRLGRELGFPTCNIALKRRNLPLHGVFACEVLLGEGEDADVLHGTANIGFKPTVSSEREPSLEVHLLDFRGDLYGETLSVVFLHRIRDEVRFDDLDALRKQISEDVDRARDWFDQRQSMNEDNRNQESAP